MHEHVSPNMLRKENQEECFEKLSRNESRPVCSQGRLSGVSVLEVFSMRFLIATQ